MVVFAALSTLLPALAFAQASIAGSARDTSGAALPGVTVEASSPALIEKVRTAVTDDRGLFRIVNLPPGVYSVAFALRDSTGEARRHRAERSVHRADRCQHDRRRRDRDDHRHRRVADRRRAEHQASDDDQQRRADVDSHGPIMGGDGAADSRHRHHGRRTDRRAGHAADDRVRWRRRPQQRRPHAGRRAEHRCRPRRQRRVDLHRRHLATRRKW